MCLEVSCEIVVRGLHVRMKGYTYPGIYTGMGPAFLSLGKGEWLVWKEGSSLLICLFQRYNPIKVTILKYRILQVVGYL